jgi:FAD/FMN-containing dehydrogenase
MAPLSLTTNANGRITLDDAAVETLAASIRGDLLVAGTPGYDESRSIWNAMIDRRPGLIVECVGAADVADAVRFAAEHDVVLSVRSGGHNIAGNAVCDGGMMISLARMTSVRVDPGARRAWVEPGNTLGDVDRETQAHGLAVPTGINSTTGIAGLTLGGGFGWLSRAHGMTVDSLVSADVVTAAGELVRASPEENPDLFWAIRGGGGNFGIVTAFEFALHPIGPEVLAGLMVYPLADARDVLRHYREFCAQAPDELTVWAVMRKAPPLPFLPEDVHGTDVLVLATLFAGDMTDGERALAPLRTFGRPIADVIGPHPFSAFQAAFDPLLTPGSRNYWKSHDFLALSDELIDTLLDYVRTMPDPQCEVFIAHMGGATNRVPADATAYPHRDAEYIMNVHGRWDDPAADEQCIAWCRELSDAAAPHATGGVYVNFMTEEERERVPSAYGESLQRLREVKRAYDPGNLFRMNQNIPPAN